MKLKITVLVFCMSLLGYTQQSINYKALVKDSSGNVVANQTIDVQFIILEDVTNVYQETHTPTTDANGLIILNIGEGTTSDVFTDIDWANDDHFLNVHIDTGSGFVDMGTTQFLAVPYALSAANVTGLEKLDEGGGYRIVGRNSSRYGEVGFNAVDFSFSNISSSTYGATGAYSLASGYRATASGASSNSLGSNTQAFGDFSTAIGKETEASGDNSLALGSGTITYGDNSTAMGDRTIASGDNSVAMGNLNSASGDNSLALGTYTTAQSFNSIVMGRFNVLGGNSTSWFPTEPLFVIGNGIVSSRNNALTILKSGKIGVDKHTGINAKLDIDHASSQTSPQINIRETSGTYARLNISNTNSTDYWAIAGSLNGTTATDRINFYHSDVGDIMSILGNGNVLVNGSVVHSSDRRLKKDIETIPYGLNEILKLQPKAYNWKSKPNQANKSLGLIAQNVQSIIKEIVHTADDENKTLSVSYTELIPILIKALQEQQDIIETQNSKIDNVENQLSKLSKRLENLEAINN